MYSLRLITSGQEAYLPLLRIADPVEKRLRSNLARGALYVLAEEGKDVCAAVMTMEEAGVCELQALVTVEEEQRKGYASRMMELLFFKYAAAFEAMRVRTGPGPGGADFYEKLGFEKSGMDEGFFTVVGEEPVYDNGVLLTDAVILERKLSPGCACCDSKPEA